MKKFTLILSLLVVMVTTAMAQTFDATKQYYLKGSATVTGYMNLGDFGKNTNVMLLDNKQALSLEMQTNATGGVCYLIAAEVANVTGGSAKKYIAPGNGGEATWKPVLTDDANAALKFTFEMSPMSTTTTAVYNIKSDKGYLKVDAVSETDNSKGVYTDGDMTSAAAWEVVEAKAEEEEVAKQYCLKGKGYAGATSVAGYMNLVGDQMMDTEAILAADAQALVMEEIVDGTNTYYTISTDVENETDKKYVAYDAEDGLVCTADSEEALRFKKEFDTTGAFNLKSDYGYVEARKACWGGNTDTPTPVGDGTIGIYLDGNNATMALAWTYDEVVPVTATAPVITDITPANGATVENLTEVVITFDKEIAKYDSSVDNNRGMRLNVTGATVSISNVTISGNTATCTLASALTKSGEYTIKIPAGSFIAADGGVFAGSDTNKFTFNGAPLLASKTSMTVENKLDVIRVSFDQNVAFVADHNIEKLEVKSGEATVAYITLSENAEIDDAVLTLILDEAVEPEVTTSYTVEIPAGLIVEADGAKEFAGAKITCKVTIPFTVKEITPTSGTVLDTELTEIVVVFSENIDSYQTNTLKLVNTEDNTIEIALTPSIENNVLTLTPATDVPNGTYSLKNLGNVVNKGWAKLANVPDYTITVNLPTTAIDAVAADADAVIYDLSGRRVKEITVKGIYIVNGKKVIR